MPEKRSVHVAGFDTHVLQEARRTFEQAADSLVAARASSAFDALSEIGPRAKALLGVQVPNLSIMPSLPALDSPIRDAINPVVRVKQPRAKSKLPKPEPPPSPHAEVERLEFKRAVLDEELAVLTEEPTRLAHPDDDWGEWPHKKRG